MQFDMCADCEEVVGGEVTVELSALPKAQLVFDDEPDEPYLVDEALVALAIHEEGTNVTSVLRGALPAARR